MAGGSSSSSTSSAPSWHLAVGISLALTSGFFIGTSLILQKKGLMQTKEANGEESKKKLYLKNPIWWMGMLSMAIGEISNFGAYAFAPTILVTPLGAISVVVSAILSVLFLKEKLSFSGTAGICLCIIGATIIVLHGPTSTATERIPDFFKYVLAPGFLSYTCVCLLTVIYLIFYLAPKYGHIHPVIYISVTSIVGAFLVNAAQGFGSSMVYSFAHWDTDNQFTHWEMYPLLVFVVLSAIMQIDYLNRTLLYFSTSIVTPVYFVFFSTATLITSAVLYQGYNIAGPIPAITVVLGFLVIVIGVALLFQYNLKLNKLKVALVEDINDAENESEDDLEQDQNPIKMMQETFPLSTMGRKKQGTVNPDGGATGVGGNGASNNGVGGGAGGANGPTAGSALSSPGNNNGLPGRSSDDASVTASAATYVRQETPSIPLIAPNQPPLSSVVTIPLSAMAAQASSVQLDTSSYYVNMIPSSSTPVPQPQPPSQSMAVIQPVLSQSMLPPLQPQPQSAIALLSRINEQALVNHVQGTVQGEEEYEEGEDDEEGEEEDDDEDEEFGEEQVTLEARDAPQQPQQPQQPPPLAYPVQHNRNVVHPQVPHAIHQSPVLQPIATAMPHPLGAALPPLKPMPMNARTLLISGAVAPFDLGPNSSSGGNKVDMNIPPQQQQLADFTSTDDGESSDMVSEYASESGSVDMRQPPAPMAAMHGIRPSHVGMMSFQGNGHPAQNVQQARYYYAPSGMSQQQQQPQQALQGWSVQQPQQAQIAPVSIIHNQQQQASQQ